MHGGRPLNIQRGVKHGDILSPILFNAAPDSALWKRRGKCEHHGIAMGHYERLTNIRYADDLMLYARSFPALVEMIETLSWEQHEICLQLNAAKRKKITCSNSCSCALLAFDGTCGAGLARSKHCRVCRRYLRPAECG